MNVRSIKDPTSLHETSWDKHWFQSVKVKRAHLRQPFQCLSRAVLVTCVMIPCMNYVDVINLCVLFNLECCGMLLDFNAMF